MEIIAKSQKNKSVELVSASEESFISRGFFDWINTCPYKKTKIMFGYLPANKKGMALSVIQSAYKTKRYILGDYEATCQFGLIYRVQPSGSSADERLAADELLNAIGEWAGDYNNFPNLGENIKVKRIAIEDRASIYAAYDDGDEDHRIVITLIYEVTKNG